MVALVLCLCWLVLGCYVVCLLCLFVDFGCCLFWLIGWSGFIRFVVFIWLNFVWVVDLFMFVCVLFDCFRLLFILVVLLVILIVC